MDMTSENYPYSSNENADESLKLEVENFLHDALEKVAFIIEAYREKQTNSGCESDEKITSKVQKQVRFSSPLTSDVYSQSEDEQTQDTIILCLGKNGNEDSFEFDDSEDEVRRKFVEEGDSFVPEVFFNPIGIGEGLESEDLLASDVTCQNLRQNSALVTDETEMKVPALKHEEEEKETMENSPTRIDNPGIATCSSLAVVPVYKTFITCKHDPCTFNETGKNTAEFSVEGRSNLTIDCKRPDNACQITVKEMDHDNMMEKSDKSSFPKEESKNQVEKSKSQSYDHDLVIENNENAFDSTGVSEENRMQFKHHQLETKDSGVHSKNSEAYIGRFGVHCREADALFGMQRMRCEEQLKEVKLQCLTPEKEVTESMVKTKTSKIETEKCESQTAESTIKAMESEDNSHIDGALRKRKIEEMSALITNDKDSGNDEDWQAEVIKKKIKQNDNFDIDEFHSELRKHEQLDSCHSIENSCSRSISSIELEDQLVPESIPDDVSDVTRQSSTTTYVMSCLDPQPYSMRLTPAPHFLSPEFNDFKPIVPKLGELVHAEQVCEKYSPPEHASSSDAPNDNTQAKKDDNNTLDGTSMDKNLSNNYDINDDDFMLMDSVANSHFTVKAPTDKYSFDVNSYPDGGLQDETLPDDVEMEASIETPDGMTCNEHDKEDHMKLKIAVVDDIANCQERNLRDQDECTLQKTLDAECQASEKKKKDVLFVLKERDCKEVLNCVNEAALEVKTTIREGEVDAGNREDVLDMPKTETAKETMQYFQEFQEDEKTRELQTLCIKRDKIASAYEEGEHTKTERGVKKILCANLSEDQSESRLQEMRDSSANIQGMNVVEYGKTLENGKEICDARGDEKDDKQSVKSDEDKDEGSYRGSQGFDLQAYSSNIYIAMNNEVQMDEQRDAGKASDDKLGNNVVQILTIRDDHIRDKGGEALEQDQTVEIAPSFDLSDVEFYNAPQCVDSPGKVDKNLTPMTLDKRHDIEVDNVWPKLASNSTAFSWSIKDNDSIFSDKQQQRTNVSNRGHHGLSSAAKLADQQVGCTGLTSSKHSPSQGILRLGLSKRRPLKRLHPYFVTDRNKHEKQIVPDLESNHGNLDTD